MIKIGVCIYYGRPYRGTCPTCGQVFLDPFGDGENHIPFRERFCSDKCAKNFKWDIAKGKEMLARLNELANHNDIVDAVALAIHGVNK